MRIMGKEKHVYDEEYKKNMSVIIKEWWRKRKEKNCE